jgi:hypothetical protein
MRLIYAFILTLLLVGCVSDKKGGGEVRAGMSRQEVHSAWGQPTSSPDALHDVWQTPTSRLLVTYDADGKVADYHWNYERSH